MTPEQKDWYNYGRLKAAWLAVRELEPGNEHILTPTLWEARKKAYRWLHRGDCELCSHAYTEFCNNCLHNEYETERLNDNWEPKD